MASVLQQIVDILVGGLTNMATGIASGLNTMATQLFVTGTGTTSDPYQLTVFGGIIAIFAGVSLAKIPMASINRANTGKPKLNVWQSRGNYYNFERYNNTVTRRG